MSAGTCTQVGAPGSDVSSGDSPSVPPSCPRATAAALMTWLGSSGAAMSGMVSAHMPVRATSSTNTGVQVRTVADARRRGRGMMSFGSGVTDLDVRA